MKSKILSTICLLFLLTIQAFTQSTWVPFLQQTKSNPVTNLAASNKFTVSFTVQINGMESTNITADSTIYQSLSIPDCELMGAEGSPQLPVITKLIAVPDCDNVSISVLPASQFELSNYNVAPAPGFSNHIEIFKENKSIYATDAFFPGKYYEILETGYVRSQKVVKIAIYPVQFNPVSKEIRAYANFNVSLSFVNPNRQLIKNLAFLEM